MRPLRPPSDARSLNRVRGRVRSVERRFVGARTLPIVFDGIGAVLTPGVKGDVAIHFDCLVARWRLLANEPGSLVVDVWKTDYPGFPPTVANTITGSDQPTLAAADKAESALLTGWTPEIADGDTLRFHIDSVSSVTRATLLLTLLV